MLSRAILLLCIMFMLTGCVQRSQKSQLELYMDAQATVNNFAGTVLVTKNDTVLLKKAYGLANKEWQIKNTIDTKFSLASVSKQFTAVAILQLVEQGLLSLDDNLSKYYPDFPNTNLITVKMLLTHNSGVSNDCEDVFSSNRKMHRDSVVHYVLNKPLLFEPGTQTAYSNEGYYLLTTLVEKASGIRFSTYMQKYIFDKTNMLNSGISNNDSVILKMAKPYYMVDGAYVQNPYVNWDYNIGLDGVYATIDDLYAWSKYLFDETTLLSEKSKQQMFTPYNAENFGYGVLVNPFYNHGRNLVGHDGGFYGSQTSFNKFVDDDVFIAVLSNNGSPSYLIAYALAAIVFDKEVELPYKHIEVSIDPKLFTTYVGEYEDVKIHVRNNELYYSHHNIKLIPESDTKFFRSDNPNRTIEFVVDAEGKASRIIVSKAGVPEVKYRN